MYAQCVKCSFSDGSCYIIFWRQCNVSILCLPWRSNVKWNDSTSQHLWRLVQEKRRVTGGMDCARSGMRIQRQRCFRIGRGSISYHQPVPTIIMLAMKCLDNKAGYWLGVGDMIESWAPGHHVCDYQACIADSCHIQWLDPTSIHVGICIFSWIPVLTHIIYCSQYWWDVFYFIEFPHACSWVCVSVSVSINICLRRTCRNWNGIYFHLRFSLSSNLFFYVISDCTSTFIFFPLQKMELDAMCSRQSLTHFYNLIFKFRIW